MICWTCCTLIVPSEEEQKSSVEQMLKYINQLPSQETFQPPPLPCVSLSVDENDVKYHDFTIQKKYYSI